MADTPPPLVARPLTPSAWAGSTANGWSGNTQSDSPWGNGGGSWGASTRTGWDAASGGAAGGWGQTAADMRPGGTVPGGGWGTGAMPASGSIPPPPGATYALNPNHVGSWGNQTSQQQNPNSWAEQDATAFPASTALYTYPQPTGAQYPYPTASAYPSGWDLAQPPQIHSGTLSAPPMQPSFSYPPSAPAPSWAAAMNMYQTPNSATSSPIRPRSSMGRSTSFSGYSNSPASTLSRSSSHHYDAALPDRPSEWRKDYSARSGLGALLPRSMHRPSYSVDQSAHKLHDFIRASYYDAPMTWDLRMPLQTLHFRDVQRDVLPTDLQRYASEPPLPTMRLVHPRLPWYIDVVASNPTGITLWDLFGAIYMTLRLPIRKTDFWNEELSDKDRSKIGDAWRIRCGIDESERTSGVRRVDYLRRHVVFEGLVKGRNGTWEMKTRKMVMGD